ncbi:hypothetical protein [Flagellimonas halotolerans]|uniref:Anti-bacteriophage protein A/HamA C-terminal domain-containing protein n=1 Tax=Flagellimonas halotolerans TaxID=3112164 RepID=A0ABU6IQW3_9FLAO|nr:MULTISPECIES: hypothetical protein [unclassified Allomuricauda]MEC3965578.1 hypothetical protein [Muricauda sp. SYSU M86414]MEC4265444.1 hypothetical protein [Muricauda sp. SYSU M84420]
MSAYRVIDRIQIEPHILFIRIEPTDIKITLGDVFKSLSDIAWISGFDKRYIQDYFQVRAEETINYIANNIITQSDDKITSDTGELVVSELSRLTVINEMSYLDIPLAELIKSQAVGNDGFDFFSKNLNKVILFGEAKFNSRQNAYGAAFEQIERFERIKQDVSDIKEIAEFCCEDSLNNHTSGKKGFIASFASKSTSTTTIVNGIKRNTHYNNLKKCEELICVAVNV